MLNPTQLLLLFGPLLVSSCEDGWTSFEGNCYKKFTRPGMQNSESNNVCKTNGATLASVLSESERQFLVEFGEEGYGIYDYEQMQIGGFRYSVGSPWTWLDGSPFTQNYMFERQSNGNNELYLALKTDPYNNNGPAGKFIDQCLGQAFLFVCKKKDTFKNPAGCGEKWTAYEGACYRRFGNQRLPSHDCRHLNQFCYNNHGAYLASVTTHAERQFIIEYGQSGRKAGKYDQWQPILGAYRDSVSSPWQWFDGSPYNQYDFWHAGTPTTVSDRTCMRIKADPPGKNSYSGLGPSGFFFDIAPKWAAYVFICKKKICHSSMTYTKGNCVCKPDHIDIVDSSEKDAKNYKRGQRCVTCDSSMVIQNGKCVCKGDLIDIVDSYHAEADNYNRGLKCVEKGKCYSVKDSTSILFMVDSSLSITDKHWPKMINFVKSGAKMMPNTFRVGFMKFSTAVSDKKWIKPNWYPDEYHDAVPSKYDNGETDTPLALQEAKKMFKNDGNKNRIAVLITDGMPFATHYDSPVDANSATKKAADALQRDGVRLTVMGVGKDVKAGEISEWLKNPRKDYLPFDDNVDRLKGSDMGRLLQLVCDF